MRKTILFLLLLTFAVLHSQKSEVNKFFLSVSPAVDVNNEYNRKIIQTLSLFLQNLDPQFWVAEDFKKYKSPFKDLIGIAGGKFGENSYNPSVMEIIPTAFANEKIVKFAYIGTNDNSNKNWVIKVVYNLIAVHQNNQILFKSPLKYNTAQWKKQNYLSIDYIFSPSKEINSSEMKRLHQDNEKLARFLNTNILNITYYSCENPQQLFHIKGFDYHPMMFADKSGGFAEDYNVVLSGNNSEYYLHEVAHLYTSKLFPKINSFLDEGFATYIGGSGNYEYLWQRKKLAEFLNKNPDFNIADHLDPYERIYFERETPVPYVLAAVLCELILEKYGKEKLFKVMVSEGSLEEILKLVSISKNNIDQEIRNQLESKPYRPL